MRSLILILIGLIPMAAMAQKKTASRTCRILYLSRPADAPKSLYLFDGDSSQEVELGGMSFSPVYELRNGDITIALLKEPPVPARGGKTPIVPAGAPNAFVKESVVDFYLILTSDPSNPVSPVRMQVINADGNRFRNGQMMWYNLTDSLVGGIVGSRKLRLNPNSREILNAPAKGHEDYPVNIHYLPPGNPRAEPLCETRWLHDPRSRSMFFVIMETGRITPRIIGIPDYRETSRE